MQSPIRTLGTSLLIVVAASCGLSASETTLGKSTWGGDAAILQVVEGGADIEFECAAGRIEGPIRIDSHGAFDVAGTWTAEGPGPTRDEGSATAVRYRGQVKGDTMTLTVRSATAEIGTYALTRDRQSILRKCR